MKFLRLSLILLIIVFTQINGFAIVDINYDGRVVEIKRGETKTKWISLYNKKNIVERVKISVHETNPLQLPKSKNKYFKNGYAGAWTVIRQTTLKIMPQVLRKIPVTISPPFNVKPGVYGIWILFQQRVKSPVILSEDYRGKNLGYETVQTDAIPLRVDVK